MVASAAAQETMEDLILEVILETTAAAFDWYA